MSDFENVQKLFDDALELPEDQRSNFVLEHCSGDTAREVIALLEADSDSEKFLANVFENIHSIIEDELAVLPEKIGDYQITALLGEGGMGTVYRGWDNKLQRTVAIKVLSISRGNKRAEKERFFQEAKAAAQLNHPNVCEIYDIDEESNGQLYIVAAYCAGEDMAKAIDANRLNFRQILSIVIQLCEALTVAHSKGIYHRDIKPANIIVDENNHIKLIDFGIAKISGSDLSQTGQLVGTFSHMAPEQFSGGHIDHRTDIWAIGILLFEAFTGSRPFLGDNPAETMYQIFQCAFPRVKEDLFPLADRLNHILKRTINLDRQARFQSVDVLISELKSMLHTLEQSDQLDSVPVRLKLTAEQDSQNINSISNSHLSRTQRPTLSHTSLSEYRKVVALGLASERSFTTNEALSKPVKAVIKEHKGQIIQQDASHIYAYFGFPLLREAYADHAVACSLALSKLVKPATDRSSLNIVLDHVPAVMSTNQKTGRKEIVSNIPWQCKELLNLAFPNTVLITNSINRRLRKPLSAFCEWQHEIDGYERLFTLPDGEQESTYIDYKERYLNPIAGRIHELGILEYTWQNVIDGSGISGHGESRTTLISGEAGMGKTRLLYELKQRIIANHEAVIIECQADPNQNDTALYPLINALREHLRVLRAQHSYQSRAEKSTSEKSNTEPSNSDVLKVFLSDINLYSEENFAILAWLINLPLEIAQLYAAKETPEAMHKKCVTLMEQCVTAIAQRMPLLLVFEDLHWADSKTLDWLDSLLSKPIAGKVFIVLTGRPELFLRWRSNTAITQLALNKLSQTEVKDLVSTLCQKERLADDLQNLVLEKSSGNPLYIEEYTKMMLLREKTNNHTSSNEDTHSLIKTFVPDTLEDLVHAKLDYLGSSKVLVQAASVIGQVFDSNLLPDLLNIDKKTSEQLLIKLVESEIIYRKDEQNFVFKHALIRDALLRSITKEDKQKLHANIAEIYCSRKQSIPEDIAFHLSAAGDFSESVSWWIKAAQDAQNRNSVRENIRLCRLGINDIKVSLENQESTRKLHTNDTSKLIRQELELQIMLGPALIAASNYASIDVGQTYNRALELSLHLEEQDQRFASMMGLWSYSCVRADHRTALTLANKLVEFAEQKDSDDLRVEAYMARGASHLFIANLVESTNDLDQAIGFYNISMSAEHIRLYSQEPSMAIYTFRALLEEAKGNGDAAKIASKKSVEAGRRSEHPFSLGFSLAFAVHISLRQQDPVLAMALREEYKALCEEQDIHVFKLLGALQEGIIQIGSGDPRGGISTIEKAIPPYMEFGTGVFIASWYGILAMTYLQLGDIKSTQENLKLGYAQIEKTEENLSRPMLDMIASQLP